MDTENLTSPAFSTTQMIIDLMDEKEIPPAERFKVLRTALGLSRSSAYRKLDIEATWSYPEVIAVEEHLGVKRIRVDASAAKDLQPATLKVGKHRFPCSIKIDGTLLTTKDIELAAYQKDGQWIVTRIADIPDDAPQPHRVSKVELDLSRKSAHRIAVLDDSRTSADSMRDGLSIMGFEATSFYDVPTLLSSIDEQPFDGYVLDWIIGPDTSVNVLTVVRRIQGDAAPIILLTGEIDSGRAKEAELVEAAMKYDVVTREKPEKPINVAIDLGKSLQSRELAVA